MITTLTRTGGALSSSLARQEAREAGTEILSHTTTNAHILARSRDDLLYYIRENTRTEAVLSKKKRGMAEADHVQFVQQRQPGEDILMGVIQPLFGARRFERDQTRLQRFLSQPAGRWLQRHNI